jgi:hypothetical protein
MSTLREALAAVKPDVPLSVGRKYSYHAYGIPIRSDLRFPLKETPAPLEPTVELFLGGPLYFREALRGRVVSPDPESWCEYLTLPEGSVYVRWPDLFEFLVSPDGRRIAYNPLSESSLLAFETYLLSMVLSYALLKLGYEVLHATGVIVDGEALALLGPSGHGKSTLAAAFLSAGYPVLTDDLLVLMETPEGIMIPPGIPRIKLFPETATRLLPFPVAGEPMNPLTDKLVIPLSEPHFWRAPAPLRAIYRLSDPGVARPASKVRIARMAVKTAFIQLLAGTFNARVLEPARLKRHFEGTSRLLTKVPVRSLSFERTFDHVPAVRDAILRDFRRLRVKSRRVESRIGKT